MKLWKRPDLWASIALLLFLSASAAKSGGSSNGQSSGIVNIVTPNQATNNQSAVGSVNQSPVGGINNNTQVNNSQATDYGFAPGIFCRGPSFSIGGFGGGSSSSYGYSAFQGSNYGAIVAINIPLPGEIEGHCRALAKEIVLQRQLDTSLNIIKQCAILQKEGITFDLELFPEFQRCQGVKLVKGGSAVPNERPQSFFGSNNKPVITVPVR